MPKLAQGVYGKTIQFGFKKFVIFFLFHKHFAISLDSNLSYLICLKIPVSPNRKVEEMLDILHQLRIEY